MVFFQIHKNLTFFFCFSGSDPNQHILDTLEQCISVIIEKIQHLDNLQQQQHMDDKNSSRMSSLDYARVNDGEADEIRVGQTKGQIHSICSIKGKGTS